MKSLADFIFESEDNADAINGFCILKPGFLNHEEDWYKMLKNNDWQIIQKSTVQLTPAESAELYKPQEKEDFYKDLCKYMSSDKCICAVCHKDCDDPIKDMKTLKHKVRDAWGKDDMRNAMHSSDSLENVKREQKICIK